MNRNSSAGSLPQRPLAFSTKSFTRFEPPSSAVPSAHRHRASTLSTPVLPRKSPEEERKDIFNKVEVQDDEPVSADLSRTNSLPDKFDELPIELASLTDRFVESLGAKSWEQPPSIEQISDLFQEFYVTAESRISIHISSLRTRLNREPSPKPSKPAPKSRTLPSKKSNESLIPDKTDGAQQMLTANEVAEKRKARKLLDYKRVLLEEAVERRACEKVYSGIWRHKSTLDEVRDEKLRSKTAALALVGIGLKDLGIDLDEVGDNTVEDVQELLSPARDGLMRMNDEKYPLGKLQHLTAAHKAIVDTLFSIHGSSSSADEILPTLIYTLVTSPVEGINIISNLNFIQRFRASTKIDGESAYCMTNLEAAIGFLENVDLSSLRAEERPEGPPRTPSQPSTPMVERLDPFPTLSITTATMSDAVASPVSPSTSSTSLSTKLKQSVANSRPPPSPRHQRTLSDLLQPVTAANEAVRNTAKEGIETISNTLDNSFKFLFGRLKEQAGEPGSPKDVIVPKTLDEARKLVNKPLGLEAAEEAIAASDTSSIAERDLTESPTTDKPKVEDKLLSLFGGNRKPTSMVRERSVDSQKSSGSSSRRVAFTQPNNDTASKGAPSTAGSTSIPTTPLDSVKNIGSSLNPLSHIGNAFGGGFRGFGRPAAPTAANLPSTRNTDSSAASIAKDTNTKKTVETNKIEDNNSLQILIDEPEKVSKKVREAKPPIAKFVEMSNANDLKIGDVQELLNDYKRLAKVLGELANIPK